MNVPILRNQSTAAEVGARFRAARDAAGLSRAQVAKLSNVSAKAIEKFEAGQQEPSFMRFAALCEAVGAQAEEILNGEALEVEEESDEPVSAPPRRPMPPAPRQTQPAPAPIPEPETPADRVRGMLMDLDELREARFRNAQRRAMALVEELGREMRFLEPEELIDLAHERDVFAGNLPATHELEKALVSEPAKGQELCRALEQRIVDTALLGADIFAIDLNALGALAKRMDLDRPMFGWDDHDEFARRALEGLRTRALAGLGEDLSKENLFPARS